ncbi:POGZ [Branchiostoma lanceolatum]|uniref:POGZ protein n=1 Tax=Branchiostoma lanceolatum TaxID=7740 RepID=A0A8J9ZLC2_BRALA|nr:POGZ [Branchiostoma lanceolatum]
MLSWLKRANPSVKPPTLPGLPNPADTDNPLDTAAMNREVEKAFEQASRKRKRTGNNHYSPEVRAKMAKLCIEIGPLKTAKKMTQELGREVNESTVRSIKRAFQKEMVRQGTNDIASFPHKNVGRPLKLGDLDAEMQKFARSTRQGGGVVNRPMIMAAAKGLLMRRDRSVLVEYGGHIEITKAWANSLLLRMNFVKRKGTKAARKLPADFEGTRDEFLARIKETVTEFGIPDDMIINWDQTGVNIVPVGDWTLEEAGARQVPVIGLEDKRQITLLLAISLSGNLIPPQVLYQGKTDACHARFEFPEEWDVFHTESHWSTTNSMERYLEKVVIPYMTAQRERLGLKDDHPGLAIFDVYKAHRTPALLQKLHDAHVKPIFVPASCTGELQPLDSDGCINDALKKDLTQSFTNFYADKVAKELERGTAIEAIKIDLRLSAMKPLHANWLLGAIDRLSTKPEIIDRGWDRTGIREAVQKVR